MEILQSVPLPPGVLAMLGGMILLYATAQSMSGAITQAFPRSAGRKGFWHAVPMGAAAMVAAYLGHGEMALGILTGCSIAALSLAPGVARMVTHGGDDMSGGETFCALLIAPTMLLWLIGMRAEMNWLSSAFLLVLGFIAFLIGREQAVPARMGIFSLFVFVLATAVATFAANLAIRGAGHVHEYLTTLTPGVLASGILAPILVLPMLGESVRLSEEHRGADAKIMQVSTAMTNLMLMLPACVLISYWRHGIGNDGAAIPFPIGIWRVDTVLLVVLAVWIFVRPKLPGSANRWEGVALIVIYGLYLISLAQMELYS